MRKILASSAIVAALFAGPALAVDVTLTKLTGLTGGTLAGTAVYRADLSSVGFANLLSITISDNSNGLGGSPGQFSGFDLDAIKLSTTSCADAACVAGLAGLNVFDFGSGTLFTAGSQATPVDPKLFGTNAAGTAVDNAVATLGAFDGENSTATPDGFLSMGFNGRISFNLTAATNTAGLFLYIGEVGDNGEVAASSVVVRETPAEVPEPSTYAMLIAGLGMLGLMARRRSR
jgi:hypothetical protein